MLDPAIALMELEVGKLAQAREGTSQWALLQAKSLGLSFLRRAKQLGLEEPGAMDAYRRRMREEILLDKSPEEG